MIRNFLCKLLRDARTVFSMVYRLLRWDWQTLFLFEFIYRLCMLAIVIPLLKNVLQWAIELGGLKVLSQYGILTLIQRPWCIPVLLLLGVVVVFFEFIELTMIIHYFDTAQKQERVTLRILWERSWRQTMRICQPKNICMLLFVAFIIPLDGSDLWFQSAKYYEDTGICVGLPAVQGKLEDPVWGPGRTVYFDLLSMDFLSA